MTLTDYPDYIIFDEKNKKMFIYDRPVKNNGLVKVTDPNVIEKWTKSMNEYLKKNENKFKYYSKQFKHF